ncbi:MAG: LysM peptidoglycan-binding domain-containing protein, partial [Candidatus Hydrogenedentes bacterium]|nr:LysM peptidoglycan-binding domain-containing protein [Candidatus Hydrogenedentota bacterium]
MLISLLLAFAALPVVDVQFAPDQPLPLVYVDDPLVVEMRPDIGADANLELQVQAVQHSKPTEVKARDIVLRGGNPYWWAAEGAPKERGYYQARLLISVQGSPMEFTGHYVRIDRPLAEGNPPLYVKIEQLDDSLLMALQASGVKTVRLDASSEKFEADAALAYALGFRIVASFPVAAIGNAATWAEELARRLNDHVYRWEIDAGSDIQALKAVAEGILRGGSHGTLAVEVPNATAYETLMGSAKANGLARVVQEVVLAQEDPSALDIAAVRQATERVGLEHVPVHVLNTAFPEDNGETRGTAFIQKVLANLAAGAVETALPPSLIFRDGQLQEATVYVSGLAHRLVDFEYEGQIAVSGAEVHLFRDGGRWLLAAWSDSPREITVRPGEAQDLLLTDALNNTIGLPAEADGSVRLPLSALPLYLTGRGGSLFAQAGRATAKREAARIAANPLYKGVMPPELMELVGLIAKNGDAIPNRINYLNLLRMFPELERRWHSGELPVSAAVPAIASLARLARALAAVEQETGQAFMERLEDMVDRAEDARSLYLTSAPPTTIGRERADWLLDEGRDLMDEAVALHAAGLEVEADAVAALSEWRARALEFTLLQGAETPVIEDMLTLDEVTDAMPGDRETVLAAAGATPAPESAAPAEAPQRVVHVVKSGDVLGTIASKYDVSVNDLLTWNNLKRSSRLKIGDEIVIHPEGAPAGDIAVAAATTPEAPEAVPEPEAAPETIAPEPEVTPAAETADEPAPAPEEAPATPSSREIVHVVARGDVPGSIADKYDVPLKDLLDWNNLTRKSVLHIGDKIVIRVAGDAEAAAPEPAPEAAPV